MHLKPVILFLLVFHAYFVFVKTNYYFFFVVCPYHIYFQTKLVLQFLICLISVTTGLNLPKEVLENKAVAKVVFITWDT